MAASPRASIAPARGPCGLRARASLGRSAPIAACLQFSYALVSYSDLLFCGGLHGGIRERILLYEASTTVLTTGRHAGSPTTCGCSPSSVRASPGRRCHSALRVKRADLVATLTGRTQCIRRLCAKNGQQPQYTSSAGPYDAFARTPESCRKSLRAARRHGLQIPTSGDSEGQIQIS
jgi:hypothetical protein